MSHLSCRAFGAPRSLGRRRSGRAREAAPEGRGAQGEIRGWGGLRRRKEGLCSREPVWAALRAHRGPGAAGLGLAGDAGAGPVPGHCGPGAVGIVLRGVQLALPRGLAALRCLRAAFPALIIRVSAVASPEVPLPLVVTSAALSGLLSPEKWLQVPGSFRSSP